MYGMDRRVRDAAVARPEGPAPIMITTGSGSDITAAAAAAAGGVGGSLVAVVFGSGCYVVLRIEGWKCERGTSTRRMLK